MEKLKFIVRSPANKPDVVEVRYDCSCGCKPRARYQKGTEDAAHEHCCCGLVHFVGHEADARLKSYLAERAAQGMDSEIGGYQISTEKVQAPWGAPVPVAYAIPNHPKAH